MSRVPDQGFVASHYRMAVMPSQVGTTDYHAKFYANQLSRRLNGDSPDKLATSLMDSSVDLNPHQIDAALFAFQSPLSNGVILADEVGLGKTIEALFRVPGSVSNTPVCESDVSKQLGALTEGRKLETLEALEARALAWIEQEEAKLDAWAEDRRTNRVGDIEKIDKQITRLRREMSMNPGNIRERQQKRAEVDKLTEQRDDLEDLNRQRRRDISRERERLMARAYERINESSTMSELFTIRWSLNT